MFFDDGPAPLSWTRAALDDPSDSGWPYIDLFHVAAGLATHRRRALFLGCGGAVALHQFASVYPGIDMDLVEHDPAVVELARAWFALDSIPRLRTHLADAVAFVQTAPRRAWDVVVVDAYGDADVASPFAGPAFYRALSCAVADGGAVAVNVIGALAPPGPVSAVLEAVEHGFRDVRLVPVVSPREQFSRRARRNVVVVGRR
jgi:spermidine synthase